MLDYYDYILLLEVSPAAHTQDRLYNPVCVSRPKTIVTAAKNKKPFALQLWRRG